MRKLLLLVLLPIGLWGQIYQHDFGTTSITTKPYTAAPTTFNSNLSSSSWTTSASGFGGLVGNGGSPSQSLSLSNSSGTPTFTLTFNVASGFQVAITDFDFWRVRSSTGAQNWAMTINGTSVGSGTIPTTGSALGTTAVSSTISGLTGTITIILTFSGATSTGTCRVDDFTLFGSVTSTCTPPSNPAGSITQTTNCGSVALAYSGTPTNIYWQTSATGTATANPASSPLNVTSTGTWHARAYDGTSCWSTGTISSTVSSIANNTAISSHPTNSSIFAAANTSFSVSATNSPSYQWQVNTGAGFTNLSNGGVYSGATTNSLTITGATLGLSGYTYRCVVTSASPCTNVVNSNAATLTVTDGPCIAQNFNSFTSGAPAGWSGSGCNNYNSASTGFFGNSANSARFDDNGDNLITPSTSNGARSLSFWMRGASVSGASAFLIEGFNGTSWVTIENITSISNSAATKSYTSTTSPALPEGITQFRFTYTKVNGNLAFDDVEIYCDNCKANVATQNTPGTYPYTVQCQGYGVWNYYGDGTNYYFAINKNGNTLTPTLDITVSSAAVDSSKSSNGANQEHASYLMKRYWNVNCGGCTPTTNGGVSVRFFYDPADSTAAHNAMRAGFLALKASNVNTLADTTTSMQWVKNNTGAPYAPSMFTGNRMTVAHIKLSPTYGTLNGVRYVEFSGIQSFSGGGGGFGFGPSSGGGVGLPVTWAGFDASVQTDFTELIWHTASEQNTSHFEVEASYDGKEFKQLGENIAAAGNSASLLSYSFKDFDLAPIKYYRLKQMDIEGSFEYSKIILAKRGDLADKVFEMAVYPLSEMNRTQYQLILKNKSTATSQILVLDYTGKPVHTENTNSHSEILNLSHLSPGIYMLLVFNGDEKQMERIVVQ
ncbi:MAG: T9SS type A sorting domain-containing protein [Chitinophagales bacterium]|jgi:hypothetical protein|nr:T9SS type A sorting domain-containing protein [Sphingobacteriales bacterium]